MQPVITNSTAGATVSDVINPFRSPFSTVPATTSPFAALKNLQVTVGNVPIWNNPVSFGYDLFVQEMSKSGVDGGLDDVTSAGLLSQRQWESLYRFVAVDIGRRLPSEDGASKSIIVSDRDAYGYYNTIRKELSKQNKAAKLDNELTPEEEKKYISYEELMSVPGKVAKVLNETYGKIFLSRSEFEQLANAKKTDYLKHVFDYITLWLNVHYPLRLVWPSVLLSPEEGANYLQGNVLHLNDFKNVRLMGPQTIQLDSTTMSLIKSYLDFLANTLGEQPSKLLWRIFNRQPGEYDYTKSSNSFSQVLSKLFMNYAKLTNREKNDLHAKLLHSTMAANTSYNKIANRANASEVSFEPDNSYDHAPEPPAKPATAPPAKPATAPLSRPKDRRKRIFHGAFTPTGSDKTLEIDIFEI
ncbi:unnamed protein product [Phytophthora lilii]|uniref:Unnamed protein product n=1 Tax=Phytophthora lilii TaxID=2077276 RepID=A0A9W6XE58_9STRA|nr:unnamed protein product [Phytophthora lilii]